MRLVLRCVLAALMQSSMSVTQETPKSSPFAAMIPPVSTIPGSFIPPAVFNPVGAQPQLPAENKATPSADSLDNPGEITLQGTAMGAGACSIFHWENVGKIIAVMC